MFYDETQKMTLTSPVELNFLQSFTTLFRGHVLCTEKNDDALGLSSNRRRPHQVTTTAKASFTSSPAPKKTAVVA